MASHPGVYSDCGRHSLGPPGCSHLGFVGLKFFQRGSFFISDLSHCWDKMPGKGNLKEEGSILAFRSRMRGIEGKRSRQECRASGHMTSTIQKFKLLSPLLHSRTPGYVMAPPTFQLHLTKSRESQKLVSVVNPNPTQLTSLTITVPSRNPEVPCRVASQSSSVTVNHVHP